MAKKPLHQMVFAILLSILLLAPSLCEAKRSMGGSNRKTGGGGYSTRRQQTPQTSVTKPTYNTNSGNANADHVALSYPSSHSQPNKAAGAPNSQNSPPIGWNVPKSNAGPPPAYSPSNVAGGAKTNVHEPPPAYQKPNYGAPPPNYAQATGTHSVPPGATYHSPNNLPPGATYYGGAPAGATYHSPNNLPPGATYYNNPSHMPGGYGGGYPGYGSPGGSPYHSPAALPQGATYYPSQSALPPGATFYSSPPQQTSSGLGFGSGLAAGALGGALLGHVLTPSGTKVIEQAPAAAAAGGGGGDRVIIINNGQPINATDGVTVINGSGQQQQPSATDTTNMNTPVPLAPIAPVPTDNNSTNSVETSNNPSVPPVPVPMAGAAPVEQPPPTGGIICVPVLTNETDPNDSTKMIQVEKIACYNAPPPPPPPGNATMVDGQQQPIGENAPLAPMPNNNLPSQQMQSAQSTNMADENVKPASSKAYVGITQKQMPLSLIWGILISCTLAFKMI